MKNPILPVLIAAFLLLNCNKPGEVESPDNNSCNFVDFKYYKGEKYSLGKMSNEYLLVAFDTINNDNEIKSFIASLTDFDQNYPYKIQKSVGYKYKHVPLRFAVSKSCEEITQTISKLHKLPMVAYAHYTFETDNCMNLIGQPMGNRCVVVYGSDFYVKVRDSSNLNDLNRMIERTRTELVERNFFSPKIFTLSATKNSTGDALAVANKFFETRLFEFSEPSLGVYPVE